MFEDCYGGHVVGLILNTVVTMKAPRFGLFVKKTFFYRLTMVSSSFIDDERKHILCDVIL